MKTTAHDYISEDGQGIAYREGTAPWASIIFAFFSLMFLIITVAFLTELAGLPWHAGKVAGLLTLLAFAGFSFSSGLLAFAGIQPQDLRFDAETKRVHGRARGRLWLLQSIDTRFDALQPPVIKSIERELDTDIYEIRLECAGHFPLALGSFEKRSHAEYWRNRLDRLLKT